MWQETVFWVIAPLILVSMMALLAVVVVTYLPRNPGPSSFWPSMVISWLIWVLVITVVFLLLVLNGWVLVDENPWLFVAMSLFYGIVYRGLYKESIG